MKNTKETPIKEFLISCGFLTQIIKKYQSRSFAEEIDFLETLKDDKYFEIGLATNFDQGISVDFEDIRKRKSEYSDNEYRLSNSKNFFKIIIEGFFEPLLIVLYITVFLCVWRDFIIEDNFYFSEGILIFIINTIYLFVRIFLNFKNEKNNRKLSTYAYESKRYSLLRGGEFQQQGQNLILTGDIIQITEGMEIPVDGLVLDGNIEVDESYLTGDTNKTKKQSLTHCIEERNQIIEQYGKTSGKIISSPILLSGSKVLSGEGKFLALLVGDYSLIRKIDMLVQNKEIQSSIMQEKCLNITKTLKNIGLISSLIILIILFIRFIVERSKDDWNFTYDKHLVEIIDFFLIAITIFIASMADSIVISISLSLAFAVKKMINNNILIRNVKACEILGNLNTILTEKTGILTTKGIGLKEIWNQNKIEIDTNNYSLELSDYIPLDMQEIFINSVLLNNTASLENYEEKGSATEIALLKFIEKCKLNNEDYKNKFQITIKLPFTSSRKRNSLIYLDPKTSKRILLVKGASEVLLEGCSNFHSFDNSIVKIDEFLRNKISSAISEMSSNGSRTIISAYKYLEENEDIETKDNKEIYNVEKENLTFLCIFGMKEILRMEIPNAIKTCQNAGIKVRMITGDNKLAAKSIALECGIIDKKNGNSIIMEGNEFSNRTGGVIIENKIEKIKNQDEFDSLYNNLDVLARARPEDKYSLVVGLKEKYIVGVTGDGTSDVPSLKKAHISFVNGISGTEMARDVSDIILLDDNFSSVVKSLVWGRNIFDSINKCIQYQITVNIVIIIITLIGASILQQNIFKPIQILWVNFFINSLALISLTQESPSMNLMMRKPSEIKILSKTIIKQIIGQTIYQLIILIILIFAGDQFLPEYSDTFDDEINKNNYPISYKYQIVDGIKKNIVRNGRKEIYENQTFENYENISTEIGPSRHFTIIFNTFIFLQIFNLIHSRKTNEEINIFKYLFENRILIIAFSIMIFFQAIIVTHSGRTFSCYHWYNESQRGGGLDIRQWLICIAFGFGGLIWGGLFKLIPDFTCGDNIILRKSSIIALN